MLVGKAYVCNRVCSSGVDEYMTFKAMMSDDVGRKGLCM